MNNSSVNDSRDALHKGKYVEDELDNVYQSSSISSKTSGIKPKSKFYVEDEPN